MNTLQKSMKSITLGELVGDTLPAYETLLAPFASVNVEGLTQDSRAVQPGHIFVALFGKNHDARDYIPVAIDRGAVAVLADAGGDWQGIQTINGVPIVAIDCLRYQLGRLAARFYGYPSDKYTVVGVTGTNGKTSCTQFIAQILTGLNASCGVVGTLGFGVYPKLHDTGYTTPDAIALQSALADLASSNARFVAMEVSSQGLHQYRVTGVSFRVALFTNLTRDHLDYHGSMQAYAEAKRRLFEYEGLQAGVVNMDDSYAVMMLNAMPRQARCITYSLGNRHADVYAETLTFTAQGYVARVHTPWGSTQISGSLLGAFNFSNVLAALTVVMTASGEFTLEQVAAQVAALKPVNGRMELIGSAAGVSAVVDYAHTPDGLKSALEAMRQHANGRIWCVFGCGGNRDQGKRPLMAEVADELADEIIVTDDNPRNENADDIVRQIMLGFSDPDSVRVERDRAKAISLAITLAKPGDLVLIAGKGHECYQDVAGQRMAFSDAAQVRLALQKRAQHSTDTKGNQP